MTGAFPTSYPVDIEDIEYLRHADKALLARLYRPRGAGPFPLIVELHGGAWCRGDRLNNTVVNAALAKSGVVVAALDFRMPPGAAYPGSMVDINYAIRWLKQRAGELGSSAGMVGIMGSSSGGHQAMLSAMRPRDPRYTALPLAGRGASFDAGVRCVVMCSPVIDPLGRYEYAKKTKESSGPYPEVIDRVLPDHEQYWQTEEAMSEGSPVRALERGERVELPPVLYLQGANDVNHPRSDLDRFIANYRKAGGRVQLQLYEGVGEAFLTHNAGSAATVAQAVQTIVEFVHAELM